MKRIWLLLAICFLMWPCLGYRRPPQAFGPDYDLAIEKARAYLWNQYEPELSLLRCSDVVAREQFWLADDNLLASWFLPGFEMPEKYGILEHGLLEVLQGEIVQWPPATHCHVLVERTSKGEVWRETRLAGPAILNWEYADLVLLRALNFHNAGQEALARQMFAEAMASFDGWGFSDRAKAEGHGFYATYKLALALYVGCELAMPLPRRLRTAFLEKQDPRSGGFYTLYEHKGVVGDTGTEATVFALMALMKLK